jgi:Xaa-Pro aminopeptidase
MTTAQSSVASRADQVIDRLAERELDSLLVTNLFNVRWVAGFTGTNGVALVGRDVRAFITDFRYVEQAQAQVPDTFERVQGKQDLMGNVVERMRGRVGYDDSHLTVRQLRRLEGLVPDEVELVAAGGLIEELRSVKDAGEVEAIRAATQLADEVYLELAERGLAGRTEHDVSVDVELGMRRRGASGPSFPSIIAGGAHGALPHAEPRDVVIESDTLVVVDMGCILDGYCSDCTRTFATGEGLSDEMRSVYDLVLQAQLASLDAVRAGASGKAVDSVARDLIRDAGRGDQFGHGLGHGVGLEIHEDPRLSQSANETPLKVGQVVTVEPGVYVPGGFGVRIEDLVVVTDDRPEILTGVSKELTFVG